MSQEEMDNTSVEDTEVEASNEATEEVAEPEVEKSQEEILQEELKACEEKYLRVHAEFENIKKRLEREKMSAIEYASEKFAKDLIPVLDALGMAIESAKTDASAEELLEKLTEGVELTLKQFVTTLDRHGVKEVEYGELNPNIHEAVMQVASDEVESGHIVQVMQKGYTYKERTLRAAMVSVAN
ncbi:MAG: nucleotide exchange factor GrpE [Thiovulaceae bacterium]|nr:nucleotide exchange factor GrpE [Sulfurimonadaceae bacterium]